MGIKIKRIMSKTHVAHVQNNILSYSIFTQKHWNSYHKDSFTVYNKGHIQLQTCATFTINIWLLSEKKSICFRNINCLEYILWSIWIFLKTLPCLSYININSKIASNLRLWINATLTFLIDPAHDKFWKNTLQIAKLMYDLHVRLRVYTVTKLYIKAY